MRLTENKLRSIIREEAEKLDETRLRRATDKYSRVANEASEQTKQGRPSVAKDHIQAMVNVSQRLVTDLEHSGEASTGRIEQLRDALLDAEVAVKLLFKEKM